MDSTACTGPQWLYKGALYLSVLLLLVILCFHFLPSSYCQLFLSFFYVAFSFYLTFFFAKCAKLKFLPFFSVLLINFARSDSVYIFIPSFLSWPHIINHTSFPSQFLCCSHLHSASYAPHHLHARCYFHKYTLPTHYLPLQCLWNVDHSPQYTTFTCFQSSFLEPFILCGTRIL